MKQDTVIVLNSDLSFLSIINWQRALKLVFTERAEIVQSGNRAIRNFSGSHKFVIPKVVRLKRFIKEIFKGKVPFSKRNIKIRDGHQCQYCGDKTSKMTIDHVIPVSKGGQNTWENCVTCCPKCNSKKGNKPLEERGMKLQRKPQEPSAQHFIQIKIDKLVNLDFSKFDWNGIY